MSSASLDVRIGLATKSFTLDVAFEAPPGVTVLYGPSGAGKSRTLGCIAGIVRPDRGRVTLDGEIWFDHASRREKPIHERRVAYVFQSLALFPHMTGAENVAYGMTSGTSSQKQERAQAMLARMRVPHLAARKPRTFSGGEAQRVALARAFAMSPRLLLLDEPFSALDAGVKRELLDEVATWLERERIPAILVTHQAEEARVLGHRVVHLEHGRVVRESSVDEADFASRA
ncbi:Molybdenum transport ATP-binding protein ModC [Labilithrix luteola]|uniref:Molybdenum transport ATP-binding protein ModC n=1 Tax=Labilithrix luteola TaxID=1391654 RepID=A0A0K1PIY2_9BACT|nr:ATP-binding cassette domain-containing protein [Labilithrix luteola]AKU93480.1 Molybdenum transport ATP-binding protein ModC [Labilithrix luteola]